MLELLLSVLAAVRVFFRGRAETSLEVLALRQQVAVLKRQRPRPTLTRLDRVLWTTPRGERPRRIRPSVWPLRRSSHFTATHPRKRTGQR